ncbi:MAG TPA: hypothetical protein VGG74_26840 [Kofleriaceae bacterium]
MLPSTVPPLPPAHVTTQPDPQPVTVHADDEQVTSHDAASEQSTFVLVAFDAWTVHVWPASHSTAQLSPAAHATLHAVPSSHM